MIRCRSASYGGHGLGGVAANSAVGGHRALPGGRGITATERRGYKAKIRRVGGRGLHPRMRFAATSSTAYRSCDIIGGGIGDRKAGADREAPSP
jgi:hypothetical protein